MGTMDTLVEDLLRKPRDSFREELVKKAMAGHYNDWKSDETTPKVVLIADLTRYGYRDLARKAMRGEYDDEPDDDDKAAFAKSLATNPRLADLWEKLSQTADPDEALRLVAEEAARTGGGGGIPASVRAEMGLARRGRPR